MRFQTHEEHLCFALAGEFWPFGFILENLCNEEVQLLEFVIQDDKNLPIWHIPYNVCYNLGFGWIMLIYNSPVSSVLVILKNGENYF